MRTRELYKDYEQALKEIVDIWDDNFDQTNRRVRAEVMAETARKALFLHQQEKDTDKQPPTTAELSSELAYVTEDLRKLIEFVERATHPNQPADPGITRLVINNLKEKYGFDPFIRRVPETKKCCGTCEWRNSLANCTAADPDPDDKPFWFSGKLKYVGPTEGQNCKCWAEKE